MSTNETTLNTKNLDQLIKALKGQLPRIHVGIIGGSVRKDQKLGETNAGIGLIHEYGGGHCPQRSFLRVPLIDRLKKTMDNSGAFDKDTLTEVVKQATIIPWLKKISVLAEGIVTGAFETGGYGKWPAWKNPNYKNGGNSLLVDTGQLRDSITSEIR